MRCQALATCICLVAWITHAADSTSEAAEDVEDSVCLLQGQTLSMRIHDSLIQTVQPAHPAVHRASPKVLPKFHDSAGRGWVWQNHTVPFSKYDSCPAQTTSKLLKGVFNDAKEVEVDLTSDISIIVLLVASLLMLLMGNRLVKPSVFIIVTSAVFYPTLETLLGQTDSCTVPLYFAAGAGLLCGLVATCFLKPSFFVVGTVIGVIVAYQFQAAILVLLEQAAWNGLMDYYWIVAVLLSFLCGVFMYELAEELFSIASSFIGAYAFEISLRAFLIVYLQYEMPDGTALLVMVGAFAVGCVVQMCICSPKKL
mmetsp:Transcript_72475/g.137719  ORF Transcript_72475/g.137719 Transcript_72475/m.137719 type:complete len:311 (-) Transcript_72475:214-1146(-)